jgi:hypothetical protein
MNYGIKPRLQLQPPSPAAIGLRFIMLPRMPRDASTE